MQTYTIRQASEQSGLPESTLRYYESIGIINAIARDSSSKHRMYSENDIDTLDVVACLNATGMPLEDMRTYMDNHAHGSDAALEQIELFNSHLERLHIEAKFLSLRENYVQIKLAYWQAIADNKETLANKILIEAKLLARDLKSTHK